MPWFKVDDGFHGHPKVVELSLAAVGLWTLAGSWSSKYLSNGTVSTKTVLRLGGDEALATELADADLWLVCDGGYAFKDWADYQPLKEVVMAERAAAQERMRAVRAKKKGVPSNTVTTADDGSESVRANTERTSSDVRVTPSQSQSHPSPIPNRRVVQAKPAHIYDSEFLDWWEIYPRKLAKRPAEKAFLEARKIADLEALMAGVRAFKLMSLGQDENTLKMAAGWLAEYRWEDDARTSPVQHHVATPSSCPAHPEYPQPCDRCKRDQAEGREF